MNSEPAKYRLSASRTIFPWDVCLDIELISSRRFIVGLSRMLKRGYFVVVMKTIFSCDTSTRAQQIVKTSKKLRKVNFSGDVYHHTKRTDLVTDIEATLDTNSGQSCGMYSSEGEEWRNHARRNNP